MTTHLLRRGLLVLSVASYVLAPACGGDGDKRARGKDAGADAAQAGSAGAAGTAGSSGAGGSGGGIADAGSEASDANDGGADANPACQTIARDATLQAHLKITADNECEVFVNGTSVGTTSNWGVGVTIDVSLFVHPGRRNVVAVRGTNTSSQNGNDRGIIGELTVSEDAGVRALVVTDDAWKVASTEAPNWTALDFDDSTWTGATEIAAHGAGPWGSVLTTTSAMWIWSAPVPASTSEKPNIESTYARRTFYFDFDGATTTSQAGCP
ncbi:MAG TPA: hypothetical protein VI072_21650 [Polyangiaceae bacterium]